MSEQKPPVCPHGCAWPCEYDTALAAAEADVARLQEALDTERYHSNAVEVILKARHGIGWRGLSEVDAAKCHEREEADRIAGAKLPAAEIERLRAALVECDAACIDHSEVADRAVHRAARAMEALERYVTNDSCVETGTKGLDGQGEDGVPWAPCSVSCDYCVGRGVLEEVWGWLGVAEVVSFIREIHEATAGKANDWTDERRKQFVFNVGCRATGMVDRWCREGREDKG